MSISKIRIIKNQNGLIHMLVVILLLLGIIGGVYLVQKTNIFKSRASSTINDVFLFEDENGSQIYCSEAGTGVYDCYSDANEVTVKVKSIDQITK